MYQKKKSVLLGLIVLPIFIISMISGCNDDGQGKTGYQEMLKNDALTGLKSAYAEDFTRLTIIRGALYKYVVNPQNPQLLGTAIGAVEATVFPEQYELKRFSQMENISAGLRKEIISQPMLNITTKKRETLNHIYSAVLKPLSLNIENKKQVSSKETAVLNNLITLLDTLAENYSVLANKDVSFDSNEAYRAFIAVQDTFREMQELELVKQSNLP